MSLGESDRWRDVSIRLQKEKLELEREIERQRLLDELSASRTRNLELETALAKLAREQDRLALAERERVLKRAQVAQATALLVQEANWAKSRMENELRLAKERLHLFPETSNPPVSQSVRCDGSRPPQTEAPTLFPVTKPPVAPRLQSDSSPTVGPPSRSSHSKTGSKSVAGSHASKTSSEVSESGDIDSRGDHPDDDVVSSAVNQVQSSVSEAAAGILETTSKVTDVFSVGYSGVVSTFMSAVQAVPNLGAGERTPPTSTKPADKLLVSESSEKLGGEVSPAPIQKATPPEGSLFTNGMSPTGPLAAPGKDGIETKTLLPPPKPTTTGVVEFPGRAAVVSETNTKVIQQKSKGQWTNMNLHAQAGAILSQLIVERDVTIQKNPELMERLYAIPCKIDISESSTGTVVQPEWAAAADAWIESVTGTSVKKSKDKSKIDPAIAAMTGVDPNLGSDDNVMEAGQGDYVSPDPGEAKPEQPPDKKGKKNCIIM
jgi:hypothetical protein